MRRSSKFDPKSVQSSSQAEFTQSSAVLKHLVNNAGSKMVDI